MAEGRSERYPLPHLSIDLLNVLYKNWFLACMALCFSITNVYCNYCYLYTVISLLLSIVA